ncbi:MAG: HAMP domain-containing histidine kinase [Bacteroidales bacterium]|nr:HAMP domain-containing histidine kinase [Candidatus Liminaster caballi]
MKKSTIWYITIVLILAFAGFIALQISYLDVIVGTRKEQFKRAVNRSLYMVNRELERQETRTYLNENFDEDQRQQLEEMLHDDYDDLQALYSQSSVTTMPNQMQISHQHQSVSVMGPDGSVQTFEFSVADTSMLQSYSVGPQHKGNNIQSRQKTRQDMLFRQYVHQRNVLDDVIFRIMVRASDRNILDRVDPDELRRMLSASFQREGCELPFEFCIVERDGRTAYRSPGYNAERAEREGCFMQVLFDSESLQSATQPQGGAITDRLNYVEVYFPNSDRYLLRDSLDFMVPSFLFSAVILFLFIFVIVVIFRSKKLSEMKNDFINNMTHEFKTPISSISLAAQMLNDPSVSKSPDMVSRLTGVIGDETKRLRFQVEKVLQMSMFDKQRTNLKLQEQNVNALVDSIVNTFRLKVEKAGGTLEAQLDADDDVCMIDEMHFTNVIFNLLDNAYKYSREDVPLHLCVHTSNPDDRHLEIRVSDNGIGIKSENLKRIFEKFYRVPTGNLHNVKGFGLGLAYVWKIVTDHGGQIKAESVFGQGTTFIINIQLI